MCIFYLILENCFLYLIEISKKDFLKKSMKRKRSGFQEARCRKCNKQRKVLHRETFRSPKQSLSLYMSASNKTQISRNDISIASFVKPLCENE